MKTIVLTELEAIVVNSLLESDTMEDVYCDSPETISQNTGIAIKSLRGVIASLIKKDLVYVDELVSGCGDWVILFEDKITN